MRLRREAREAKQALFPPDPGDSMRRRRNFDPLAVAIHGLKQCIHCGRYWNRDVNAARNIGWVFVSMWLQGERSVHLQRSVFKNSRSREGAPSNKLAFSEHANLSIASKKRKLPLQTILPLLPINGPPSTL